MLGAPNYWPISVIGLYVWPISVIGLYVWPISVLQMYVIPISKYGALKSLAFIRLWLISVLTLSVFDCTYVRAARQSSGRAHKCVGGVCDRLLIHRRHHISACDASLLAPVSQLGMPQLID